MDRLIGTGVALVTPFDEQQRIDRESLYRLVNYVIDGGVDFWWHWELRQRLRLYRPTKERWWYIRFSKPIRGVFP